MQNNFADPYAGMPNHGDVPPLPNGQIDLGPEGEALLAKGQNPPPSKDSGSGYVDSAAAVPGTPSPAQPSQIGQAVVGNSVLGQPEQQTPEPSPYNQHGFYQPSKDDIAKFDQAVAQGIDLDQVDPRFKASVYVAKGGDPMASLDVFKTLIWNPAKDSANQQAGDDAQKAIQNPLGFAVTKAGDAWNWMAGQVGSIASSVGDVVKPNTLDELSSIPLKEGDPGLGNTVRGVAAGSARVLSETEQTGANMWNALGSILEFKPGQAGALLNEASTHARNASVLLTDGTAKAVNDVGNMITTAATLAPNFASWGLNHIPGIPQNVKDAADARDAQINFNILNFQKGMDKWSDGFSGKVADGLVSLGSATNQLSGIPQTVGPMLQSNADQTKASEATITPAQMLGARTVTNPLNFVGPAEATGVVDATMRGLGFPVKPSYLSAIKDSGDVLSALKAEEGSALSKLGAAQDLKVAHQQGVLFDSGQIIADLKEQQAAAYGNIERAKDARTANLPPDGGPPHPQFDQNIAAAQSNLAAIQQKLDAAVQAHPRTVDQIPPSFQQNVLDRNITDLQGHLTDIQQKVAAATQDHQAQIQAAGTQLQRNVGLANQIVGRGLRGVGGTMKGAAVASKWVGDRFNAVTNTIAGGNPQVAQSLRWMTQGIAGDLLGRIVGQETMGAITGEALPLLSDTFGPVGETLGTIGKEFLVGEASSPFAARVAQNLQGLPQWAARALDNSFFNDISKTTSAASNTGIHAGLINAGVSFAGSGGNMGAAAQGLISGGILGMGGGAFKTWRDFGSRDQIGAAQVGDRYRFMQSLDRDTKAQFQKYTPETQLTLGSYFSQHPDLRLRFDAPEGSGGHYEVNATNQTATIHIDPTAPDGALPLIAAHEFNHYVQDRGLQAELTSRLLGNPDTGEPGYFARFDAAGKAVRSPEGGFAPNDDLLALQAHLQAKYTEAGFPEEAARITPERTLRELAAESAVGLVSPGTMEPRATLVGKLLDAGTAPFVTKNFQKSILATLGNGFDLNNNIVGTGLFTGEKRIPILDNMLQKWYNNGRKLSPLDSGDSSSIVPRDLAGKTDAEIRNITGAVDTWKTDSKGKILRTADGAPIVKTKKAMDAKANEVGSVIHTAITGMGPDARLAAGIREDGSGGWLLPSRVGGGLEKLFGSKLNPEQLANLKKWTDLSSIDPGAALALRYQAAYYRGKFKQPVPGSIPIKEHTVMPMRVQVTKSGNLIGHAFAHDQLLENAEVAARKGLGKQFGYGDSPGKIYDAARNMIETISKGQPAESVVSPDQKRFLYELTGLDPKVNGQNIFSDISKEHRSESVWKTFRLDRINRASIDPSSKWAIHSGIYDPLIGYRTTGKLALGGDYGTNVHPTAFGRPPDYSRGAATVSSQQAPYAQHAALAGSASDYIRQVAEPPTPKPAPAPRAQLVQQPAAQPAIAAGPTNEPVRSPEQDLQAHNAQLAKMKPGTSRLAMARNIISLETDTRNGLKIETLPPGDAGGPGQEIAGINRKYDGPMFDRLKYLVESGRGPEAFKEAARYIASQTDGVYKYVPRATLAKHPGIEQYLRDTFFHQGEGAVKRILSRAMGFGPQYLTPNLAAHWIRQPGFLEKLRQTRQMYMDVVQQPAANLRAGVSSRIDHAARIAAAM
jgi:hypothetical protein